MFMAKGTPRTAWPCRYVTLFYGCLDADCFLDVLCGLIIAGSSGKVLFTHLLRKYMQLDFKKQNSIRTYNPFCAQIHPRIRHSFLRVFMDVPVMARTFLRLIPFRNSAISFAYCSRYLLSDFLYVEGLPILMPSARHLAIY